MPRSIHSLGVIALALLIVVPACLGTTIPEDTATASLTATVVSVTDGDTVDIEYQNGTNDTIRLLGVDTPEVYGENTPKEFEGIPNTEAGKQCLHTAGEAASAFMKDQLSPGEQITVVLDEKSDGRGDYGRLLAYIQDDGQNLNYRLIQTGHARVYDSTFSQSERFYAAETEAQNAQRGLWHCRDAGSSGVAITMIHADASGDDTTNLNDEYVVLTNTGTEPFDLAGWTVADEAGHTYTFPDRASLAPNASVTLHTGSGSDTQADRYWDADSAIWNNGGDTVSISNATGTVMTSKSY